MNALLGYPLLDSVDYRPVLVEEGSAAEQATAIFCNVLELHEDGSPLDGNEAEICSAKHPSAASACARRAAARSRSSTVAASVMRSHPCS